jgi:hypothetical protein
MEIMKYFEVLYKNCFGKNLTALVVTQNESPSIPTVDFNFNWNGNRLIDFKETDFDSYRHNIKRFFTA